jgi:thymidylate synthase
LNNELEQTYLNFLQYILDNGVKKEDRTGTGTISVFGYQMRFDLSKGFPLFTTKRTPFRLIASELLWFIKGDTNIRYLLKNNNHIWDEWAYPKKAPYGHSQNAKESMLNERDLGPIYGFQWRHFGAEYDSYQTDYTNKGYDQLKALVRTLKTNPYDRRMILSAWNPPFLDQMALPPCHYAFQLVVIDGALNLLWNQRSVDVMLGLPFNIASYALLLHLLAKEGGLKEGKLIGFLADVHIYVNHVDGAREQLSRNPCEYALPTVVTEPFTSIFEWTAQDTHLLNYVSHPTIKFQIAV